MGAHRGLPSMLLLMTMPAWIDCQRAGFAVDQVPSISAPEGSTVTLPCNFVHPWKQVQQVIIIWKWRHFHGPVIFNSSMNKQNRYSLVGNPKNHTGSLQIRNLKKADGTRYFCRISIRALRKSEEWQNITGTLLTVTEWVPSTTTITSKPGTTRTTEALQETAGPLIGPVVGGSLGGLILMIAVPVLIACLIRRRAGKRKKEDLKAEGSPKESEADYAEVGQNQHSVNCKPDLEDRGLVYASLTLSDPASRKSPGNSPFPDPREPEMLYTAVRGQVRGPRAADPLQ